MFFAAVFFAACGGSEDKTEALFQAIIINDVPRVQKLVKAGADLDAEIKREDMGLTPLMLAAMWGNIPVMKILLEAGADPNKKCDAFGETALTGAAGCDAKDKKMCAEAVILLIKAGADPNVKSKAGMTPVIVAAMSGNPYTIEALVEEGANINARLDNNESTPLMMAAFTAVNNEESKKVVEALLEAGADPGAEDSKGRTAAQAALEAEKIAADSAGKKRALEVYDILIKAEKKK